MNDVYEQAKEKFATCRSEADIQRQLPELWRVQLARTLRAVAARLERFCRPRMTNGTRADLDRLIKLILQRLSNHQI